MLRCSLWNDNGVKYSEQPLDEDEGSDSGDLSARGEESSEGEEKDAKIDFRDNVVLATLQDGTMGKWKEAQVAYSYPLEHKVRYACISLRSKGCMRPLPTNVENVWYFGKTHQGVAKVQSNFVLCDGVWVYCASSLVCF